VLTGGTAVLQDKPPVEALDAYVNGFHFYNGDMSRTDGGAPLLLGRQ
jgi:hypothetical protein